MIFPKSLYLVLLFVLVVGMPAVMIQLATDAETASPVRTGGSTVSAAPAGPLQGEGGVVTVSFTVLDWIRGDVNRDGRADVGDAILILRSIVGLHQLDETQEVIADLNNDGKVDVGDAILLLRIIVGLP